MWLQYDHLVAHLRGGDNSLENIVITCTPCNYARMNYLVQEIGLENSLCRAPARSDWSGLEEVLSIRVPAESGSLVDRPLEAATLT